MTPLRWLLLATHVPASGHGGGMVRYTVELAAALRRRPDVDLHVLATPAARPILAERLGADRVHPVPDLPVPVRSLLERGGGRLLPALDGRWDVVHGAKHLVPRRAGTALRLLTVHDLNPLDRPGDFGSAKRALLRRPYLASLRDADALVCVSAATRERLGAWAPDAARRAAVVHLAPSASLLTAVPQPVPQLAGRPFALVVGDPSPRKNLALVLRVWPQVAAARADAVLAVVGPPSWGPSQLGAAAPLVRQGRVLLLGHRAEAELAWLYRTTAALLFPSQLEGFGLPVVEGMALGAPVLVSDDPALAEAGGTAAVRLSPHDPSAWRDAIHAVLARPRARTAPAVPPRTWDDVAAETVKAVSDVR